MQRARRFPLSLVVLAIAFLGIVGISPVPLRSAGPAAAVGWPISAGALIAEVVTGGASASDEYVEIANAGTVAIDLQNVELIYVSATGTSPTRKAMWAASRPLAAGQHLLVANSAGLFAGSGDATYTSGIAATGGAVALRVVGGAVIDAVGWGDATNAFVEGAPAGAPDASASIERRPGGTSGNATDTNSNAADFVAQAHPVPQNLASPPVVASPSLPPSASVANPPPTASPTPTEPPGPTGTPVITASPSASATEPIPSAPAVSATTSPEPTDTPVPTDPGPTSTPAPTGEPPPTPAVTDVPPPTPAATDEPPPLPTEPPATASPTVPPSSSAATPPPIAVEDARAMADGALVTVQAVLTTPLGAFDSGRGAFVEDTTAGIGLYLDAPVTQPLSRGTLVLVTGVLDERYSHRILRVTRADIEDLGGDAMPAAAVLLTGDATEAYEGRRVTIEGTLVGSPSDVADGVSLTIDDGSGPVKVIVGDVPAGLASGVRARATGPLGQHDSGGTGTAGYRIYALDPVDLVVLAPPTPSLSPTPTATPAPSPTPTPVISASTSPSPSATASPSPSMSGAISISVARAAALGSRVHVRGTAIADSGRVGPSLVSIVDATGGLAVHLPSGAAGPGRGSVLDVVGDLAAPYGQLEIRPAADTLQTDGTADQPDPVVLVGGLDESLEGSLVSIDGTVATSPTTNSGDVSFDVDLASGARIRVQADASSGVSAGLLYRGTRYRLTGVVGQHASALGRLDGYRIWLRGPEDVVALVDPSPSATPAGTLKPTGSPRPSVTPLPTATPTPTPTDPSIITIAAAIVAGGNVAVEGIVTAGSGLLDAAGRSIVIQDASAGIQVRLPVTTKLRAGVRVRVVGSSGRSYGAPRIVAKTIANLGLATVPAPLGLATPPSAAVEWRLVRITGSVTSLRRSGKAWKAEISGSAPFLVQSLAGASIPPQRLKVGGTATVTGIARRAYPSAKDRRFAILPRSVADVVGRSPVGADTTGPRPTKTGAPRATGGVAGRKPASTTGGGPATSAATVAQPVDVDLVDLPASAGLTVRVGGMITATSPTGIAIDDGTAVAIATLSGDARAVLPQLSVGLSLNLVGTAAAGSAPRLTVTTGEGIVPIAYPAMPSSATDASVSPGADAATSTEIASPSDAFGLSGAEAVDELAPAAGNATLIVGLLLSLALVGIVAVLLGRRPALRAMAHPVPGTRR